MVLQEKCFFGGIGLLALSTSELTLYHILRCISDYSIALTYPPKIQVGLQRREVPAGSQQCEVKLSIHNSIICVISLIELINNDEN